MACSLPSKSSRFSIISGDLIDPDDFHMTADPARRKVDSAAISAHADFLFEHLFTIDYEFHLPLPCQPVSHLDLVLPLFHLAHPRFQKTTLPDRVMLIKSVTSDNS